MHTFFFMHGGRPPASIAQSGLTTGNGAFMASRSSEKKNCSMYIKSGCKALPEWSELEKIKESVELGEESCGRLIGVAYSI